MLDHLVHFDQTLTLLLNGSHSLWLDGFAMAVTATATWIPAMFVLLYIVIRYGEMREIIVTVLAVGLCVLLADQIASGIFKPLVERPRPAGDSSLMLDVDVVNAYRGGRYGFFSSHAANTFAVATFTALLVRERVLTLTMVSWALLNCWSRVYLGVHYVGDILCGILCGVLVGYGVFWAYHKILPQHRVQQPTDDTLTAGGFAVADVRLLTLTLLLLYVWCCFRGLCFS